MLQETSPDVVHQALEGLSCFEQEIVKLRWGVADGYRYTLEEVGRIFKMPPDRVREVEAQAVRRLTEKTGRTEGDLPAREAAHRRGEPRGMETPSAS